MPCAREVEHAQVEGLEARAVIEVAQVGELVAQRVHEARILERASGGRVPQPDADPAVGVAHAVAVPDVGALGLDRAIAQAEAHGDPRRVAVEALHQRASLVRIHSPTGNLPVPRRTVK